MLSMSALRRIVSPFLLQSSVAAHRLSSQYGFIVSDRRYISLKSSKPFLPRITCAVMKSNRPLSQAPPRTNCSRYRSPHASHGAMAFNEGGCVAAMNLCTMPVTRLDCHSTSQDFEPYQDVSCLLIQRIRYTCRHFSRNRISWCVRTYQSILASSSITSWPSSPSCLPMITIEPSESPAPLASTFTTAKPRGQNSAGSGPSNRSRPLRQPLGTPQPHFTCVFVSEDLKMSAQLFYM
jgi:hypothetical protein